jgi:hypothetical protein
MEAKNQYFASQKAPKKQGEKKHKMCIKDTKLGVTMVLNHEDCQELGFSLTLQTDEVIEAVRTKLGLQTRAERRQAKKAKK